MLTLGIGGCNDKTGMAAWGAGMNKNIAWILAILFGGAALGTWYLGRDTQTVDPAVIAADGTAEPASAQTETTTSDTSVATSPTVAKAGTDNGSDVSDTDTSNTGTQEPSAPDATVADQTDTETDDSADGSTNTAPVLETARIDADGAVVIAGRAGAGAQVDILVDDAVVETVTADSLGNFVALFDLPKSKVARSLTLRVGSGDGVVYAAQDIIIAPSQIAAVQAIPETAATAQISATDSDSALATQQSDRQTAVVALSQGAAQTTGQSANAEDTSDSTVTAAADAGQGDDTSAAEQVDQTVADAVSDTGVQDSIQDVARADMSAVAENVQAMENLAENLQVDTQTKAEPLNARVSTLDKSAAEPLDDQDVQENDSGAMNETAEISENATNADLQQPVAKSVQTQNASDTEQAQLDPAPASDTGTTEQSSTDPQPTVFAADASGVKVLQGAETMPTDQIVMDAISYDIAGGVILSGRGQAGAVLQFYLDNALTQTAQIDAQGYWTQDMSNVAPGVYTLRLDQLDGAGQVSARFETPFKREDRAALAAAAVQVAQQAVDAAAVAQDQSADTGAMTTSVPTDTQPAAVAPVQAITVQPGNTLWGISRARYGQGILYVRVFDANRDKIRDPDLIYPGQVFVLPSQAQ